jgi:hypothetical protein
MSWNCVSIVRPGCTIFTAALQCVNGSRTSFCAEADGAVPISAGDNIINPRTFLWAIQNRTNRIIYYGCWNVTPLTPSGMSYFRRMHYRSFPWESAAHGMNMDALSEARRRYVGRANYLLSLNKKGAA